MELVSWLNRTFRTNILSAPLAALAGGAEGVSVMHPIEAESSTSPEEIEAAETAASPDAAPETPDTDAPPSGMSKLIMDCVVRYSLYSDQENEREIGAESSPIARLANTIFQQAIKERASDIHIEPGVRQMRVRYRIDGVLHEVMPMPLYMYSPLTRWYKMLAGIDMATHRRQPQEGLIPVRYEESDYTFRVNTLPTQLGDHLTFRITSSKESQIGFTTLGFVPAVQAQLENVMRSPRGLLLLAGPSGSGKTTLQDAVLNYFTAFGIHIAALEERARPPRARVTQVVVDPSDSSTMVSAIRATLRSDVDVLSIGDILDAATAQAAFEAAAGSQVVATIRGDNTLSTLIRLMGMGLDPGLITETVRGVVAQRLVRKICTHCKETYEVESKELHYFRPATENPEEKVTLARGLGCTECRQTGYRGRIGLYEVFEWEPTLTKMFADRAPLPHLKEAAFWNDRMRDLKADGLVKILAHLTTPEEVYRVL